MKWFPPVNLGACLLCLSALSTVESALAQIEEVTVTATRRDQSTQDVNISVTAFSGDALKDLGITRTSELAEQTPNLQIVEGNYGLARPIITLRGIVNDDFTALANAPIIVYSDDVLLNSPIVQGFAYTDVERVEVLRGPQGTLFGRNAVGGAIQLFSRKPTEQLEGDIKLDAGNFNHLSLDASVSVPLIEDWLLSRIAVSKTQRDGYLENIADGKKIGDRDWTTSRLMLAMPERNGVSVLFKAQHIETESETVVFHNRLDINENIRQTPLTIDGMTVPADVVFPSDTTDRSKINASDNLGSQRDGYQKISTDLNKRPEEIEADEFSVKVDWDLGAVKLTSITAYLENTFYAIVDNDNTQLVLLHSESDESQKQFSQEFRASYTLGPVDMVTGVYYMDEEIKAMTSSDQTDNWRINLSRYRDIYETLGGLNVDNQDLKTLAVFTHAQMELTDHWSTTMGVRWSEDKKEAYQLSMPCAVIPEGGFTELQPSIDPANNPCSDILEFRSLQIESDGRWEGVSGEVGLEYVPNDDYLFYGKYSRGFKSGGFAGLVSSSFALEPVENETVDAFELGMKSDLLDKKLRLNMAAFYYDYQDYQVTHDFKFGGIPLNVMLNVPEARLYGAELELDYAPIENLYIRLGLGRVFSEFLEDAENNLTGTDLKGNNFRNSPDWNFNGSVSYTIVSRTVSYTPRVSWSYVGDYYGDINNTKATENVPGVDANFDGEITNAEVNPYVDPIVVPGTEAGDYWSFNAQLSVTDNLYLWDVTFWVKNLTDEEKVTGNLDYVSLFGSTSTTVTEPRTYGASFTYYF